MTVAAFGFGKAVGNMNVREELLNIASSEDLAFEMMPSTAIEPTVNQRSAPAKGDADDHLCFL